MNLGLIKKFRGLRTKFYVYHENDNDYGENPAGRLCQIIKISFDEKP